LKNRNLLIVAGVLLVSLSFGCESTPEEIDDRVKMKLDPALSSLGKQLIRSDVQGMLARKLDGRVDGYFEKVFKGRTGLDVVRYLDQRVNYLIPDSINLGDRIRVMDAFGFGTDAVTMATNIGMAIWLASKGENTRLGLRIGNLTVPVDSSRVGIIQLGAGYLARRVGSTVIDTMYRTGTLIHEGRHSDCTGGLKYSDYERMRLGLMPEGHACGHLHKECPLDHDMAGLKACDGHAWGAYAIEGVYSSGMAKNCTSCSESEKQSALASATESFSRVLVLDDMLAGKLGDPDMSSSADFSLDAIREMFNEFRKARRAETDVVEAEVVEYR